MRDAQNNEQVSQLLHQIRQQDEQHIHQLHQHLSTMMGGQLNAREVGGSQSTSGNT